VAGVKVDDTGVLVAGVKVDDTGVLVTEVKVDDTTDVAVAGVKVGVAIAVDTLVEAGVLVGGKGVVEQYKISTLSKYIQVRPNVPLLRTRK